MSDQKIPGGSGPYLTKDAFYVSMNDMRDRQDANKKEVLAELRRVSDEWKKDCNDDIGKVEGRVTSLESSRTKNNMLAAVIAGVTGVITAAITAAIALYRGG